MINSSDSHFLKNQEVSNTDQSIDLLNEIQIVHSMEARHAAQHGDLETLTRLLQSGQATPDSVDSDDCSLLHWAAINNRLEIASLLIKRKCNVNAIGGILSSTPLHWASRHGHLQMVALLVKNGANWTLKDVEGFTPLHIAVQFGCTPVAAFLIAVGQSPDEPDDTDMTPAMWAAYKINNVYPLRMLALMGADLEKSDANYVNTALHWAVVQGNYTAVNTLLKLMINLEAVNKDKETPLDIARRKNDLLAIRLIEMALRERGIHLSTWRQRLDEDKRIARGVLFCIPFFTTFCSGLIFNSNMDYLSKFELLFLLFMSIIFAFRYFVKERHEPNLQSLFLGAAISSKIFFVIGWLLYLHLVVPVIMQIIVLILMVVVPLLFYKLFYSDPGFINATYQDRCRMIISMTEDESWNEKFCSTCLILKPVGTKHCRVCNRCVIKFDHHCPWVSNCVGALNHKLFLCYLLLLNLSTILLFVGCLYYWHDVCGQISSVNVLYCKPWVAQLHIYSFFFLFWISIMCFIQGYDILIAKSNTNKLFRRQYRSLNCGGTKFNVRCPLSTRCLRKVCSFGCTIGSNSDFENESRAFVQSYSSI